MKRLLDFKNRRALRARLDEEMAFHLDQLIAEHERRGMSSAAAKLEAKKQMGSSLRTQESYREQAGLPGIEELVRDLTLALRNLQRRPGYAGSMIGLLGLGLAASLTVFVLTDAMLRRDLSVPRPDELFLIGDEEGDPAMISRAAVERLAANLPNSRIAAYGGGNAGDHAAWQSAGKKRERPISFRRRAPGDGDWADGRSVTLSRG